MLKMNADQIIELMRQHFPEVGRAGFRINALSDDSIEVGWPGAADQVRPGGTISGPAMMTLVDTAAYFLVLAHIGPQTLAVTTNLNINFLRRPEPGVLIARGRMLKLGSRLVVTEISLHSGEDDTMVAHATVTYSVPPGRLSPSG
jgi:uncharacterized protein (TIGR00369 family)